MMVVYPLTPLFGVHQCVTVCVLPEELMHCSQVLKGKAKAVVSSVFFMLIKDKVCFWAERRANVFITL